jgi:hypothetical protein
MSHGSVPAATLDIHGQDQMPASSSSNNASYAAKAQRAATFRFFNGLAFGSAITGFVRQQHAMCKLDSGKQHQLHVLQQDSSRDI